MGLIDGSPRSANVVAAEACELLFLSKDALQRCLQDNLRWSRN
jgi:CRP/FNR family cyclic AMP-dependent transcriptional regulator